MSLGQKKGGFPPKNPLTLKEAPWVLLVEGEQLPRRFPDLGQGELHPPDFPLVPQPIFPWKKGNGGGSGRSLNHTPPSPNSVGSPPKLTDELQLLVKAGFLEGTSRGDVGFSANPAPGDRHGGGLYGWGFFWGGNRLGRGGQFCCWSSPHPKMGLLG